MYSRVNAANERFAGKCITKPFGREIFGNIDYKVKRLNAKT
jgi:hypothetical protein